MDETQRSAILAELGANFGGAEDVSPALEQPMHVLLPSLLLPGAWSPSPTRALLRFTRWPDERPEMFIDDTVRNGSGERPRNWSSHYILGEAWMAFSAKVSWAEGQRSPTRAVRFWVARFSDPT